MDIVASRRHFNVTEKDRVMYNGSCYQLMTQSYACYRGGFGDNYTPVIPKTTAKQLIKQGKLVKCCTKPDTFGIRLLQYYKFVLEGEEQ